MSCCNSTWYLYTFAIVFAVYYAASKLFLKFTTGFCKSQRRLDGKVAIVTGASSGLGYETAKDLARRGAKVIMACFDMPEAEEAANTIRSETNSKLVIVKYLDVSLMSSVRKFCKEFKSEETRLDILVNNAGIAKLNKMVNAEGFEMHFATNHLGHFLLTNILLETLKKTVGSRIVVVASIAHNWTLSLDTNNLNSELKWEPKEIYAKTKLSNILFMREMHRRLKEKNIRVAINALNPGGVKTKVFDDVKTGWLYWILFHLAKPSMKTPWEGAQTHMHLCASEEVEGKSGEYYSDCKIKATTKLGQNMDLAKKLWEKSEQFCKIQPNEMFF